MIFFTLLIIIELISITIGKFNIKDRSGCHSKSVTTSTSLVMITRRGHSITNGFQVFFSKFLWDSGISARKFTGKLVSQQTIFL